MPAAIMMRSGSVRSIHAISTYDAKWVAVVPVGDGARRRRPGAPVRTTGARRVRSNDGVRYTCRRPDTPSMTERTARVADDEELRFAAVMLVVSVIVLVAIIREARSRAE